MKTFGPSVGAENAKQIGGIFPTTALECAAVLGSPHPFAQRVVLVGASAPVNCGPPAKVPAQGVAIISSCLSVCAITVIKVTWGPPISIELTGTMFVLLRVCSFRSHPSPWRHSFTHSFIQLCALKTQILSLRTGAFRLAPGEHFHCTVLQMEVVTMFRCHFLNSGWSIAAQVQLDMEGALTARDHVGIQDFVLLDETTEAAFLGNLQKRFTKDLIYVSLSSDVLFTDPRAPVTLLPFLRPTSALCWCP